MTWPGLTYTDPADVLEVAVDTRAPGSPYATGYGRKIPTGYRIRYRTERARRWLRVYVMQYGNAGSPYVVAGGQLLHLDTDTEHRLMTEAEGADS